MKFIKLAVLNPVLVNLLMITVIILGTFSFMSLPRQIMPEVSFHWVFIATSYDGVGSEEIEKLITIPIEDELASIENIKLLSSTSVEGLSMVQIQFDNIDDDKYDKLFQEVKSKVQNLRDLPDDAEDSFIQDFGSDDFAPMVNVILNGDLPSNEMKRIAEDLKDEIESIKNIGRAQLGGVRDREIWVEVDPTRLYSYNLALDNITSAIKFKNRNVPGGTINVGRTEYILRTIGELDKVKELENVIIRKSIVDGKVLLKDVATISDTLEKARNYGRLDGISAITLSVSKKPKGNAIELVAKIKALVANINTNLPKGTRIHVVNDMSAPVNEILGVLASNAAMGLILVLVTLYFFLGLRNAIFAAIGIPVTFMATFIFLDWTGNSLNTTSLFGLVLVLGIIVDDAIIVIENCYRYIQKGYKPHIAAIIGTQEVLLPVFSATLTTVAAFLPLMFVPGIMGEFFKVMPIVVILALIASLFESFGVLPSHIADWTPTEYKPNPKKSNFLLKLKRKYTKLLIKILKRRLLAIASVVILFFTSIAGVALYLGVDFFAGDELPQFFVWVTMPEGTTLEETDKVVRQLEIAAMNLPQEDIFSIVSNAGIQQTETEWFNKPNVGQVIVELVPAYERSNNVEYYINEMRAMTSNIAGIKSLEYAGVNNGPPVGAAIELKIKGRNFDNLRSIAGEVKTYLENIDGVFDIKDNFNFGKQELKIIVDEERAAYYGFDIFQIASFIRTAFDGTVATKFRDDDEEIDVIVKFTESEINSLESFDKIKIPVPENGTLIPLKDIVKLEVAQSITGIYRTDRQRTITVTADVDASVANSNAIINKLLEDYSTIGTRYPGYSIKTGGQFAEFAESMDGLAELFLIGIFLIYVILGGQFRSFVQPLIILFTIPFSFIGAIFGLLLINSPFSIISMYGIVALAGIVVNDALVLISFINNARQANVGRWKSIIMAGSIRLRPIILTTVTTVFGLLPMAMGLGGESATWGPLATTIVGGMLLSTVFTLFIIPCLYAAVDDVKFKFGVTTLKPNPHLDEINELSEVNGVKI